MARKKKKEILEQETLVKEKVEEKVEERPKVSKNKRIIIIALNNLKHNTVKYDIGDEVKDLTEKQRDHLLSTKSIEIKEV